MGLEKMVEDDARKDILQRGGGYCKFVSPGRKGVPDDALSHPNCGPWLMEFKAPLKKSSKLQRDVQQELANEGWTVYRDVSNIKKSREIIEDMVNCVPADQRRHAAVKPQVFDDGFGD